MAASYNNTLPTNKDWVRWKLADTGAEIDEETNQPIWLRQDEEVSAVLVIYPDRRIAAAELAESIAAELSRRVDSYTSEDGMAVRWSERVKTLLAVAKQLRADVAAEAAAGAAGTPAAFGSTEARRAGDADQAEYVRPFETYWSSQP